MKNNIILRLSFASLCICLQTAQANDLSKAIDLFKAVQKATQTASPAPAPPPAPAAKPATSSEPPVAATSTLPRPANAPVAGATDAGLDCKISVNYGKVLDIKEGVLNLNCQKNEGFVAPSVTRLIAEGERKIQVDVGILQTLTIANPYLPLAPVTIAPNVRIGHEKYPGFFYEIKGMQCTADDGLLVTGGAGFVTNRNPDQRYPYAKGVWRVSASGSITPHGVYRYQGDSALPKNWHICDRRECKTASRDTWALAIKNLRGISREGESWAENIEPSSNSIAEDKHGNVWIFKGCQFSKFSPDGKEQVLLDAKKQCIDPHLERRNYESMEPHRIVYDSFKDEMLLEAGIHLNPDAAERGVTTALWRVTQSGQMTEVFTTHWAGPKPSGRKNILPGKIQRFYALSADHQGRVRFILGRDKSGPDNPRFMQIEPGSTEIKSPNPRYNTNSEATCFDSQGNWYMMFERYIRKLSPDAKHTTTWVF